MNKLLDKIKSGQYQELLWHFALFFAKRMSTQRLHISAGYLAYVTLMSLVPLMVVMVSVMTAFPIFTDIKEMIENFVYHNFLPASGDTVKEHITGFVDNASKMSAVADRKSVV